jgi:hypothetical protein
MPEQDNKFDENNKHGIAGRSAYSSAWIISAEKYW